MFASSIIGESPPPAPRACFGRDELINKIVSLAENLTPISLIGAGGIGKTSVALTVLHHDRIKQRFGANRRFIRCEQFSASSPHLLSQLSKVIGAGIENPKDLASLRSFLSLGETLIVLDNAESILDPEGTDAEEIYGVVEELSQFDNVCLCITSRISAVPPDCDTIDIPTLSIDASRDTFHRICKKVERSDLVDDILGQLDFHPLSITLLATVAHQNRWSTERLTREWGIKRTRMLHTMHNKSLAATIELSLASPMFQELGPDARALLEVVAFFPQGVDENNLSWLFPTISDGANILDRFCVLSLAYRSNSFVTMLAPLRDHLRPKDPKSSPLLCTTKEQYFTRMSVHIDPDKYRESQWIVSEDVNVEHLLDVFTTVDASSDSVWDACADFMDHLDWHKGRLTILGPKMEGLPDNHCSKPKCLFALSQMFHSVGNYVESRRLLTDALKLYRERGDNHAVAQTLKDLSHANQHMGLPEEGMRLTEEAILDIFKQLSANTVEQAKCLMDTARFLHSDNQLDAAEVAACRAIDLVSGKGERSLVCQSHRILGNIYCFKGETEKAIHHFETASEIASSPPWDDQLFFIHAELASLFLGEDRFGDAQNHLERAMLYMTSSTYYPGHAMEVQAALWRKQGRLEEARSEILRAADVCEKLGAAQDLERCRDLLREIEGEMTESVNLDDESSDDDGELFVQDDANCCAH